MAQDDMLECFDDRTIQALFGHEAAEDENKDRLRSYYFKSQIYERIAADLPLRILVGHKGTGKSALFAVAQQEDAEAGVISVLIRPDDVLGVANPSTELLVQIRDWKEGLLAIIFEKVLGRFGLPASEGAGYASFRGGFVPAVVEALRSKIEWIDSDDRAKGLLASTFLIKKEIHVYLDDLDRGWAGDRNSIMRMSSMLNALRDLAKEHEGLFFRVALRSDVYFLVRTADESTDKIEGSVVWQSWSNHEILAMLVKRIESFFGRDRQEKDLMEMPPRVLGGFLSPVMVETFSGEGHWRNVRTHRVLMSLIRKRPRDLVKLCTLAAQEAQAGGERRIFTKHLTGVFERYSQERLQDTTNEFRTEVPHIERLLLGMKPNRREQQARLGYMYTTDELLKKIQQIEQGGKFKFANGRPASTKSLAQFLYKINFLTARNELASGEIVRRYFEENKYLSSELADFGFNWEVHPAYRWALQPGDLNAVFAKLELSAD